MPSDAPCPAGANDGHRGARAAIGGTGPRTTTTKLQHSEFGVQSKPTTTTCAVEPRGCSGGHVGHRRAPGHPVDRRRALRHAPPGVGVHWRIILFIQRAQKYEKYS